MLSTSASIHQANPKQPNSNCPRKKIPDIVRTPEPPPPLPQDTRFFFSILYITTVPVMRLLSRPQGPWQLHVIASRVNGAWACQRRHKSITSAIERGRHETRSFQERSFQERPFRAPRSQNSWDEESNRSEGTFRHARERRTGFDRFEERRRDGERYEKGRGIRSPAGRDYSDGARAGPRDVKGERYPARFSQRDGREEAFHPERRRDTRDSPDSPWRPSSRTDTRGAPPAREQLSRDEPRFVPSGGRSTTETVNKTVRGPDSFPYTTAASEFIYGHSSVLAAIKANRRKFYKLYVHSRGASRDGLMAQIRAHKLFPLMQEVGDEYLRAMDKASSGRPHNGVILESSPLPVPPITELKTASIQDQTFRLALGSQSAEDLQVNGRQEVYSYKSDGWRHPLILYVDGVVGRHWPLWVLYKTNRFRSTRAILEPLRGQRTC